MSNHKAITELIRRVSGQAGTLTTSIVYIDLVGGDHMAALLLSQIVYWSDKSKRKDGGFYKSYPDWFAELRMTQYQVKRAVTRIQKELPGVLTVELKRANNAPTLHYYLDIDKLTVSIIKFLDNQETSLSRNSTMDYQETSLSDYEETQQSLTETTTKNTTEITKRVRAQAPAPDWRNLSPKQVRRIPEIAVYIEVTGRYPGRPQQPIIFETIRAHKFTVEDLEPFWREWAGVNGYQPHKLAWLTEWAVAGEIPGRTQTKNGTSRKSEYDAIFEKLEAEHESDN